MTHITCRPLTAKNRDQLWNPTLSNRVWATFLYSLTIKLGPRPPTSQIRPWILATRLQPAIGSCFRLNNSCEIHSLGGADVVRLLRPGGGGGGGGPGLPGARGRRLERDVVGLAEVDVAVDGLVDAATVERLRLERLAERRHALEQRLQVAEVRRQRLSLAARRRHHLTIHRVK